MPVRRPPSAAARPKEAITAISVHMLAMPKGDVGDAGVGESTGIAKKVAAWELLRVPWKSGPALIWKSAQRRDHINAPNGF